MTKFCMFFGVEIVFGDTQRCSNQIHELQFIVSIFKPKEIPHINHIQSRMIMRSSLAIYTMIVYDA